MSDDLCRIGRLRHVERGAFATLALAASSLLQALPLENKWRLQFSGNARSDGTLVLAITPSGGAPVTVPIEVASGTRENMVAKRVVDVRARRRSIRARCTSTPGKPCTSITTWNG